MYAVYFYYEDGDSFAFYSRWTRVRRFGESTWKQLSAFDFEKEWVEERSPFFQFELVVVWRPNLEEEEEPEPWQAAPQLEKRERMATLTLDLRRCLAVRQIYWNEGEEIPPFRED